MNLSINLKEKTSLLETEDNDGIVRDQLSPELEEPLPLLSEVLDDHMKIKTLIVKETFALAGNESTDVMLLIHGADKSIFTFSTLKFQKLLRKVEQDSLFLNCFAQEPNEISSHPHESKEGTDEPKETSSHPQMSKEDTDDSPSVEEIIFPLVAISILGIVAVSLIVALDDFTSGTALFLGAIADVFIITIWFAKVDQRRELMHASHLNSKIRATNLESERCIMDQNQLDNESSTSNQEIPVNDIHSGTVKTERKISDFKSRITDAAQRLETTFGSQVVLLVEEEKSSFRLVTSKLGSLYHEYLLANQDNSVKQSKPREPSKVSAYKMVDYVVLFICFASLLVLSYVVFNHRDRHFVLLYLFNGIAAFLSLMTVFILLCIS